MFDESEKEGVPKKDGSGEGKRKNKGRGGCEDTEKVGKGRNKEIEKLFEVAEMEFLKEKSKSIEEDSKIDKIEKACYTRLMTSESFYNDLPEDQREAIATGRCQNLIKSFNLPFTAKFYEVELDDSSMYVTAKAITEDHIDFNLLEKFAKNLKNLKIIWRHFHPTNKKSDQHSPIYGYVREYWFEEEDKKTLYVKMEILGIFEYQKKLQEFIKQALDEGNPLGVSFRYYNFAGKFVHLEELGITPIPACDVCKTIKIEKVSDMANSEEIEKRLEDFQDRMKDLEEKLESKDSEIEKLNGSIEAKDVSIKELEGTISNLKSKVDFLKNKKPVITEILEKVKEEKREDSAALLVDMTDEQLEWVNEELKEKEKEKFPNPTVQVESDINPKEKEDREKERVENLKELGYINSEEDLNGT